MLRHCCCLDYKYYHLPTDFGSQADFVFATGKQKQNSSQIFVLRPCPLLRKVLILMSYFFSRVLNFVASSCCVLVVKPEKNVTAYAL